jgi:hypothetical protein
MLVHSLRGLEGANVLDRMSLSLVGFLLRRLERRNTQNASFANLRCILPYKDTSDDGSFPYLKCTRL